MIQNFQNIIECYQHKVTKKIRLKKSPDHKVIGMESRLCFSLTFTIVSIFTPRCFHQHCLLADNFRQFKNL